mmetsp:Transcript_21107/g.38176  ORF Transcript_21107/g.38176 Transcript_21107/m.38176 type:complete len:169 (-) Transcript_21107:258-764(-)
MRSDDDDSSGNDSGPAMPSGVLRSRGGWDDVLNIEMEHQRERLRSGADESDQAASRGKAPSHAAVDLAQFRNEEVGKGYQAKHVIRQKEASSTTKTTAGVVDMTGGKFSKKKQGAESSATRKRSRDDGGEKSNDDKKRQPAGDAPLESYLKCKGMRDFMTEIDKILKQ